MIRGFTGTYLYLYVDYLFLSCLIVVFLSRFHWRKIIHTKESKLTENVLLPAQPKTQTNKNRARDRTEKMRSIEIYDCRAYQRMRLHYNGAGLMCHELCHLIHQFALQDGLRNTQIIRAYLNAKSSGLYDKTVRRDWAGQDCDTDIAYAMVDHKEFFAELSSTFLCDTYKHLEFADSTNMISCSPPLMEPTVIERVRQRPQKLTLPQAKGSVRGIPQRQITRQSFTVEEGKQHPMLQFYQLLLRFCKPQIDLSTTISSNRKTPGQPCNKFYPFTRRQFRQHDSATYEVIKSLWKEIELWEDPDDNELSCGKEFGWFSPFAAQSKFLSHS